MANSRNIDIVKLVSSIAIAELVGIIGSFSRLPQFPRGTSF
ncbi:MAG: hypothetical protein QXO71_05905 [Candidatus Jordarchaeaceae archaeon]